jgi:sensor histidine kinase regulating citrate/malate metabolism
MSNLYSGSVNKLDGRIVSNKGENHGYGLDNVKGIVDKYDGSMVVECGNGKFEVDVVVYI